MIYFHDPRYCNNDNEVLHYLNSISVIAGQWEGDSEGLCMMKSCLIQIRLLPVSMSSVIMVLYCADFC